MTYRYSLDRVGELEWVLFDREKAGTPKTYALFLVPLPKGIFNYQLILTTYDAVEASSTLMPTFTEEIYSMFFYSIEEGVEPLVMNLFYSLQSMDIDNPLELVYFLGGTVRSKATKAPTILGSN
jgi:hypothetical protein